MPAFWHHPGFVPGVTGLILVAISSVPVATGTTLQGRSLIDLVQDSDVVVRAGVSAVEPRRNGDGRIVRHVLIEVERYLVGDGPSLITVQLLGGELPNAATRVFGEAELNPGDRNILFLERAPTSPQTLFIVSGMAQGRFAVTTDPDSGLELVSREIGPFGQAPIVVDDMEPSVGRGSTCYCTTLNRFEALIGAAAGPRRATAGE